MSHCMVAVGLEEQGLVCRQLGLPLLNPHCSGLEQPIEHDIYTCTIFSINIKPQHPCTHTAKSKERVEKGYIYCTINILKYLFEQRGDLHILPGNKYLLNK